MLYKDNHADRIVLTSFPPTGIEPTLVLKKKENQWGWQCSYQPWNLKGEYSGYVKQMWYWCANAGGQSQVSPLWGKWPHTDSSHGRVSCKQRRTTASEHKLDQDDCKNSSRITLQNNNDPNAHMLWSTGQIDERCYSLVHIMCLT